MSVFLERVIMIQAKDEGQNGRTYNPHGFWRPNAGEGPGENNVWIRRYRRGKINHRRVESARLLAFRLALNTFGVLSPQYYNFCNTLLGNA